VGGGVETFLLPNLTLKGEYRYAEFDSDDHAYGPGDHKLLASHEPAIHTGRLSINDRFNWGRREVVAPPPLK
jgi:opacity protein-like surface antigen